MWRAFQVLAMAAGLIHIAPASAAVITINYTGQIFGGAANASDGTFCGVNCSSSGYDFTGQAFSLTYIFDTSAAGAGNYTNNGTSSSLSGAYNNFSGGTFVGYAIGLPSVSGFTPAGCTIPGCSSSELDSATAGSTYNQSVKWSFSGGGSTGGSVSTMLFANPLLPGDITAAFALTGPDIGSGSFNSFFSPGAVCEQPVNWQCQSGSLQIEGVSVSISTTPLPAGLSLFAIGLGTLGLFGWRRIMARVRFIVTNNIRRDQRMTIYWGLPACSAPILALHKWLFQSRPNSQRSLASVTFSIGIGELPPLPRGL